MDKDMRARLMSALGFEAEDLEREMERLSHLSSDAKFGQEEIQAAHDAVVACGNEYGLGVPEGRVGVSPNALADFGLKQARMAYGHAKKLRAEGIPIEEALISSMGTLFITGFIIGAWIDQDFDDAGS